MADDELEALNALEKEASEFNKVCALGVLLYLPSTKSQHKWLMRNTRIRRLTEYEKLFH